jgi:hypothetical protein
MDLKTKEFDPMQVQYAVTPPLEVGYGKIAAANQMNNDQAHEFAKETRNYIEETSLAAGCGCIDGRCVLHTLDGHESKLGPKTAGGIEITTLLSMEMSNAFNDGKSVYSHAVRVIDVLEDGNMPIRFHIDADHEEGVFGAISKYRDEFAEVQNIDDFVMAIEELELTDAEKALGTGCGMSDQLQGAASNMARLPRKYTDLAGNEQTESSEEVEQRLSFIKGTSAAIDGSGFSEEVFEHHVDKATELLESGFFKGWSSLKMLVLADRILAERGLGDGVMSRLEVLETSKQGVHGHVEDLISVTKAPGYTINQTKLYRETGKQVFTYDQWIARPVANATVGSLTNSEALEQSVAQGFTEVNVAGAYQLTNGTQRAAIFS